MPSITAIITRTKNRPLLLRRAVRSVLQQISPDWMHVIVNDGGDPDEVKDVVEPHTGDYAGRLKIVTNTTSIGMEAASNLGIRACQSDYILIHDDDDSLEPEFLTETVRYLGDPPSPQIAGVVSLVNRIDERIEGDTVYETGRSLYKSLAPCIGIAEMANLNPFPPISFLYRRSVLDDIGWYDEKLPVLGDWDFNLRFIMKHDIGVIQKRLCNYHHRPSIVSGDMGNTVHAQSKLHWHYNIVVRNRFARMAPAIGMLMQQRDCYGERGNTLRRLYRHPVLGRIIRAWARWINPSFPTDVR